VSPTKKEKLTHFSTPIRQQSCATTRKEKKGKKNCKKKQTTPQTRP
jgi:hypothetical protein